MPNTFNTSTPDSPSVNVASVTSLEKSVPLAFASKSVSRVSVVETQVSAILSSQVRMEEKITKITDYLMKQ